MKKIAFVLVSILLLGACKQSQTENEAVVKTEKVDSLALSLGIDEDLLVKGRHIDMEGAANFRDIGGYKTKDGKSVKWSNIYRSGKLSGLTDNDRNKMKSLGIKTVVDFRTNAEVEKEPDALDASINYFHFPIGEDKWAKEDFFKKMLATPADSMDMFMTQLYQEIPIKWANSYKRFFEVLSDAKSTPLVFHCAAGKDRAGIATALVLNTLGVDTKTIEKDYLLSNYYRHEDNKNYVKTMAENGIPSDLAKTMLLVSPANFEGIISIIDEKHGSRDSYIKNELNVGDQVKAGLRNRFLN